MSGEENTTQSIITCHAATSEFTLPILMAELTEKLNHLSFPIFWRIKKKKSNRKNLFGCSITVEKCMEKYIGGQLQWTSDEFVQDHLFASVLETGLLVTWIISILGSREQHFWVFAH